MTKLVSFVTNALINFFSFRTYIQHISHGVDMRHVSLFVHCFDLLPVPGEFHPRLLNVHFAGQGTPAYGEQDRIEHVFEEFVVIVGPLHLQLSVWLLFNRFRNAAERRDDNLWKHSFNEIIAACFASD